MTLETLHIHSFSTFVHISYKLTKIMCGKGIKYNRNNTGTLTNEGLVIHKHVKALDTISLV